MNILNDYDSENPYPEFEDEPATKKDRRNFMLTIVSALLTLVGLCWLLIR